MPTNRRAIMAPVNNEIMPLGFAQYRLIDDIIQQLIIRRRT